MTRFVVKRHRPWQLSIAIIILSMFIASLTWLMLDKSHWSVITDRLNANRDHKLLWEVNQALQQENIELRERVLMLERTTSVDTQTAKLLQNDLTSLQDEIYRLKGELEFYQGIMDASRDVKGLNVQGIHIEPLTQPQGYRLKLILTNVAKSDNVVTGDMDISLEGMQNDATIILNLKDITLDKSLNLGFSFRHFNRFESNIALPEGFTPQRIFVQLLPKDKRQSKIKKIFDWPKSAG